MRRIAADQRCQASTGTRPRPALRVSPKLPDAWRWLFVFRFHEAAVRDLTQPATSGHPSDQKIATSMTGLKAQPP
jgi:hypothetical protein